ncbi:GntR family transcriptional regulator [Paracoccus siganidrum]|uniref:FCD domain-containing protein n=1 Tax=Paracoccus siganidrum TaxID=1276757 RepID=A0A418ZZ92_9RHOB|nr:FCD domain-containing protein [Paracoccus siganidrum]RJL05904.1 FCD domain-containing protein [Paracoccus siganidrum]RMC30018.1 transcriptional regulator [Paracoccus siganidrum]
MARGNRDKGENLTTQAYKQIRADILACRITPGQKLKISDLVARLGFSLGAVREALSRLTSEGLVLAEANKGYRVAPITRVELEDLTATRIMIECACLKDAIAHGDLKWESEIVSSLYELSRIGLENPSDPGGVSAAWAEAHQRFHHALVAACQSAWLMRIREMLYVQSERYRSATVPLDRSQRDLHAEHKAIADAAIARDPATAGAAMAEHLSLTTRILLDSNLVEDFEERLKRA